ncbi:MAG: GerMN domain-containing protein [Sporolactobacillus sp.]
MFRLVRAALLAALLSLLLIALSACGAAASQPSTVNYVKSQEALSHKTKATQFVERQLFLANALGLLVPRTVALPESRSPVKQVLSYLVADGPVSDVLPNGFQATLPAGTEIESAAIDADGALTVNCSKDLLTASAPDVAIQSIVWTATQFRAVKSVTLRAGGKTLSEWPKTGEMIGTGLTRGMGINQSFADVADAAVSEPLTVYYLYVDKGKSYEVPVTVRVQGQKSDIMTAVNTLIHEPAGSDFISPISAGAALIDRPTVKDGVVYLHFNKAFYEDASAGTVSDEALRALVLTLTGQHGIDKIAVKVGRSATLTLESGKTISGPVSRTTMGVTGL